MRPSTRPIRYNILTYSPDDRQDNPDGIGIDGAMKYLGDIHVQLDEITCLGIAELLKSPSMGEFTRENFLAGWRSVGYLPSPP